MSLKEYLLLLKIKKGIEHGVNCCFSTMTDRERAESSARDFAFFNGKTPQQEYDLHTERRNALKKQFEDELI